MKIQSFHVVTMILLLLVIEQIKAEKANRPNTHFQKIVLTAKERLGTKASDNQRVNNCKVPIEKRGSKPRPHHCQHINR